MTYCFKLNGQTEQERKVGFPDPQFHQLVYEFLEQEDVITVRLNCPRVGILPFIHEEMRVQRAKEYFCCFSNRVGNCDPLSVTFRV